MVNYNTCFLGRDETSILNLEILSCWCLKVRATCERLKVSNYICKVIKSFKIKRSETSSLTYSSHMNFYKTTAELNHFLRI